MASTNTDQPAPKAPPVAKSAWSAAAAAGHTSTPRKSRRYQWNWSPRRGLAAKLVAVDDLPDVEIVKQVGISRRVFYRWKKWPEFQARVNEHREDFRKRILGSRYCRREHRILVRQQLIDKCLRIIEERSNWPGMEKIPGGKTGLVIPQVRQIAGRLITEYVTDTATETIIRANLREIAQEVGELRGNELGPGVVDADGRPVGQAPVVFVVSPTQMQVAGDRIVDVQAETPGAGQKKALEEVVLPPEQNEG
jgi:hypothetical protein